MAESCSASRVEEEIDGKVGVIQQLNINRHSASKNGMKPLRFLAKAF